MLKDSTAYKCWVGDDTVIAEREKDGTLITVTETASGYNVYRTFDLGGQVAVSVDISLGKADDVIQYLLNR